MRGGGGGADVEIEESNVVDKGRVSAEAEVTALEVVEAAIVCLR